jgi:ADP-ribosyl-[dinitrogen reductase] hydrolase
MTAEQINTHFGGQLKDIIGGGWLHLKPGQWTDDTDMTIAVARGILANPEDPIEEIGKNFLAWMATDPPDIGSTIRAALRQYKADEPRGPIDGSKWHQAANAVHMSGMKTAGNGALMRTLPVALAYEDPEVVYKMAIAIARMTHWDIQAGMTCAIYCNLVRGFLMCPESDNLEAMLWGSMTERFNPEALNVRTMIRSRIRDQVLTGPLDKCPASPTGYTVDSLICALWSLVGTKSLEECIIKAVNLGGDADTIGAIAGGLAGVYYGYEAIPERWLDKFTAQQKKQLDDVTNWMLAVRGVKAKA